MSVLAFSSVQSNADTIIEKLRDTIGDQLHEFSYSIQIVGKWRCLYPLYTKSNAYNVVHYQVDFEFFSNGRQQGSTLEIIRPKTYGKNKSKDTIFYWGFNGIYDIDGINLNTTFENLVAKGHQVNGKRRSMSGLARKLSIHKGKTNSYAINAFQGNNLKMVSKSHGRSLNCQKVP